MPTHEMIDERRDVLLRSTSGGTLTRFAWSAWKSGETRPAAAVADRASSRRSVGPSGTPDSPRDRRLRSRSIVRVEAILQRRRQLVHRIEKDRTARCQLESAAEEGLVSIVRRVRFATMPILRGDLAAAHEDERA